MKYSLICHCNGCRERRHEEWKSLDEVMVKYERWKKVLEENGLRENVNTKECGYCMVDSETLCFECGFLWCVS